VKFVSPYGEQLQRLAADQTLREAMTGFALGPGPDSGIAPQHRAGKLQAALCPADHVLGAFSLFSSYCIQALIWNLQAMELRPGVCE